MAPVPYFDDEDETIVYTPPAKRAIAGAPALAPMPLIVPGDGDVTVVHAESQSRITPAPSASRSAAARPLNSLPPCVPPRVNDPSDEKTCIDLGGPQTTTRPALSRLDGVYRAGRRLVGAATTRFRGASVLQRATLLAVPFAAGGILCVLATCSDASAGGARAESDVLAAASVAADDSSAALDSTSVATPLPIEDDAGDDAESPPDELLDASADELLDASADDVAEPSAYEFLDASADAAAEPSATRDFADLAHLPPGTESLERRAVDAAASGSLALALDYYRALEAETPGAAAFASAAKILADKLEVEERAR